MLTIRMVSGVVVPGREDESGWVLMGGALRALSANSKVTCAAQGEGRRAESCRSAPSPPGGHRGGVAPWHETKGIVDMCPWPRSVDGKGLGGLHCGEVPFPRVSIEAGDCSSFTQCECAMAPGFPHRTPHLSQPPPHGAPPLHT